MDQIKELKALIDKFPKKIIITTHQNPDGDAMGSSLGLLHYLEKKGHEVLVVTPNEYPEYLHWLPGHNEVMIFKENKEAAKELIAEADMIFCLDFNNLQRIAELGTFVKKASATKVLIDHHLQPTEFADYMFCNALASSTAELVYDFIIEMDDEALFDENIATCLYTGIMTDTGAFQYSSTTSKVHRMVAELIDYGVNNYRTYDLVYNHYSENRVRFFGFCLIERLRVFPEYNAALIYLNKEDQEKFNVVKGDTEGLVNLPMQIKGLKLSVLITDRDDTIKLSLRSKGDFDVNKMARKHFNGGGHKNAAGGSLTTTLDAAVNKFIDILPDYKAQLTKPIKIF